jgi:hypothetical protein
MTRGAEMPMETGMAVESGLFLETDAADVFVRGHGMPCPYG